MPACSGMVSWSARRVYHERLSSIKQPRDKSGEAGPASGREVENVEVRHLILLFTYCNTLQHAYLCNPYAENMQQPA
jgi:hypothetical protein